MFGHFKYNVMPFGLMNAPIIFQNMMNDIFKEFLNNFMIIYIHDILIFSKNLKEHEQHVCFVYNKLWEKMLSVKLKKSCLFHQSKVRFLSYIIFDNGLSEGSKKIQIVIFSLWHQINFLGICKFLSKITQRLLHLQHNSCKQGQIQTGWEICQSFQIVEECFHHSSHFDSWIPIQTIFSWKNAPNFIFHVMLFLYGSDYIMLDWIQGNFQWLK
jgi:hypothetical protein